ncbi:MAG: hypothetical protein LBI05_11875 [Planctomycetaceae bacterium]|jgi:hypothetical protein|nr:hypothetical protein [Planctomycetaceae bacterium]
MSRFFLVSLLLLIAATPSSASDELFVGWSKPKLLLFFTGFLDGYIEPCGCAGADQMKGGLSRRHTCLQQLERKGWEVMPIDAGNLNKGFGQQEELKFSFVIDEAYRLMNYHVAGIGDRELLFPTEMLFAYTIDAPGTHKRYTSANVALLEFSPDIVVPYRILEQGGMKIGVVSVMGDSLLKNLHNEDIITASAALKLQQEILPKLTAEKCDRTVLIIHGSDSEINKLLDQCAGKFDFILPSNTSAEPPLQPKKVGKALIVEVGEKGRYAVAMGLFDDPKMPIRYERIPLDVRYENSATVMELMKMYQDELKKSGLAGLGIKPIPNAQSETLGNYAGAQSCADCHESAHNVWKKTNHAKAWQSLTKTAKPARDFDPECIACHVVGWNVTEQLPYKGGFLSEKETPRLVSVGCESCHGPGENHARAESGSNTALQENLRKSLRIPVEGGAAKKHCLTCHDGENSPHFDFDTYWQKIVHKEDGL